MNHNSKFQIIPAKPTFGSVKPKLYASDYINRKKSLLKNCSNIQCKSNINIFKNQVDYIETKNLYNTNPLCCGKGYINHTNLNINLLTEENLKDINVLKSNNPDITPTTIDITKQFIYNYTIDPSGELFGNTTCGINDWASYFIYNSCKR